MTFLIAKHWAGGSIGDHFAALARELAGRGHRSVVIVWGGSGRYRVEDHDGNPAVWAWPTRRPVTAQDARFLWKLANRYRPDCVIGNFSSSNLMMLIGWLARVRCRVDWYHTLSSQIDADSEDSPGWTRLLRVRKSLVYRLATHVVPVSSAASRDLQHVFGVPEKKCRVFHNSLPDPLRFDAEAVGIRDARLLVCAGRLTYSKGQDVLLEAIALLANELPRLQVEFLGSGPDEATLRALAEDLGLAHRVRFVGTVPSGEVLDRMRAAAMTIVPSRSEAFGYVNIESMSVGTPVIASRVGGIPEVVRDGIDGVLVPPGDPKELAAAIQRLLTDHRLRSEMGSHARKRFLLEFEEKGMVRRQADWLEQIAQPEGRRNAGAGAVV